MSDAFSRLPHADVSGSPNAAASGRPHSLWPGQAASPLSCAAGAPPCGRSVLPGKDVHAGYEAGQEQNSWRKRHPWLFRGGMALLIFLGLSLLNWLMEDGPLRGERVGLVRVEGMIVESGPTVEWIERLRQDSMVRAVVVRINSPGGAVGPSQEIYLALKRLARDKPVVASMGSVAASGGYYIALAAQEIYAVPSTLTASIGVKLQIPNAEGLLRKIGVSSTTLATGALKDAGAFDRPMTPAEEAYFTELIRDMYEEFIATVATERDMSPEAVRAVADGRAMTGRQALEAGLVDTLGDRHEAVLRAARLGGYGRDAVKVLEGPPKPSTLLRDMVGAVLEAAAEQRAFSEHPQFFY